MTAIEFLETQGIELEATCLITMISGFMRQPDLCALMDAYASVKIKELDLKISNNGGLEAQEDIEYLFLGKDKIA